MTDGQITNIELSLAKIESYYLAVILDDWIAKHNPPDPDPLATHVAQTIRKKIWPFD